MEPRFVEGGDGIPIATWELSGRSGSAEQAGGRRALLVAHATGFHSRCYRALAEGLGDPFRVVGFDLRGHGRSGAPPLATEDDGRVAGMGWDRFGQDALAVVDALGLGAPVAFGHSTGGVALLLAEQRRPGSFAAIYAYEPVLAPPEVWARIGAGIDPSEGARRRRPAFASRAAALEHFSSKPPLSLLRGDVLVDYVEGGFADRPDGTVGLRCDPEVEAATYAMAVGNDAWAHLPEVGCPVTIGCGGARADIGSDVAAVIAGALAHGRVDEHLDLGHLGPFEDPDEVAESVAAALTG